MKLRMIFVLALTLAATVAYHAADGPKPTRPAPASDYTLAIDPPTPGQCCAEGGCWPARSPTTPADLSALCWIEDARPVARSAPVATPMSGAERPGRAVAPSPLTVQVNSP